MYARRTRRARPWPARWRGSGGSRRCMDPEPLESPRVRDAAPARSRHTKKRALSARARPGRDEVREIAQRAQSQRQPAREQRAEVAPYDRCRAGVGPRGHARARVDPPPRRHVAGEHTPLSSSSSRTPRPRRPAAAVTVRGEARGARGRVEPTATSSTAEAASPGSTLPPGNA